MVYWNSLFFCGQGCKPQFPACTNVAVGRKCLHISQKTTEYLCTSLKRESSGQSVTFVKILIRMNVRIYSYQQNYTNEYPNIFILICLTRTNVRISICIENCMNIWIYSNIHQGFTLLHTYQRMSEYIFMTNIFKYSNIKYICHTLIGY